MALTVPADTQVDLRAIPDARQRTVASTEMLTGGLKTRANLGATLQQAGKEGVAVALKMQQEKNVAAVASADIVLGNKQLEFEQQAKSLRGQQTADLDTQTATFWDKAISETTDGLENDAQRAAFTQRAQKARLTSTGRMVAHQQKETERAAVASLNASMVTNINDAAANAGDSEAVSAAIQDIRQKTEATALLQGWDGETKAAYLTEKLTAAHKAVITSLLDQDPTGAAEYYADNKKQIAGADRAAIEKSLDAGKQLGTAQAFVDNLAAKGGTYAENLEAARKIADPEDRKLTVQLVKEREAERRSIVTADQQDAKSTVVSMISGGAGRAAIPVKLWDRMDGAGKIAAEKLLKQRADAILKPNPRTSQEVYFNLLDAAREEPEAFAQEDLSAYIGVVSEAKLTELKKLQGSPEETTMSRTKGQLINASAGAAGLDPKKLAAKGDAGDEVRAYYNRVDEEIAAYEALSGKITTKEIRDIADRMAITVITERRGWFDKETAAGIIEIEGVPTPMIDELAAAVKTAGKPVTDTNIKALYQYLQTRRQ